MKRSAELKDSVLLENIIRTCQGYYKQEDASFTKEDYIMFIGSLADNLQKFFIRKGLSKTCKSALFKRYMLEASGKTMEDYMAARLSSSEFKLWQAQDLHFQNLLTSLTKI